MFESQLNHWLNGHTLADKNLVMYSSKKIYLSVLHELNIGRVLLL